MTIAEEVLLLAYDEKEGRRLIVSSELDTAVVTAVMAGVAGVVVSTSG